MQFTPIERVGDGVLDVPAHANRMCRGEPVCSPFMCYYLAQKIVKFLTISKRIYFRKSLTKRPGFGIMVNT